MAGGREIFGYPKTDAVIERLNPIPEDPSVDVKVLHFKKYGPDETPNREPLVKVVKIGSEFEDPGMTSTSSKEEMWLDNDLAPYFNLDSLIPPEIGVTMPQILMRQFHDSTQFGEAIFREVITLPIRADSFAAVGRIMGNWEIVLAPSASHPIAATLGLQSSNTAKLSFWSKQNFTVPTAHRIWP
jgi:hypothetical protein